MAEALLSLGDEELAALATSGKPALTVSQLKDMAAEHYDMARRYGWTPEPDKEAQ